jgi:amino acid transporter
MSDHTPGNKIDAPALRPNSLGLRHAIIISIAVISPAASIFFNTIPQAGLVGASIPLCFVIGFVLALLVANQYSEFSREIPSSGSAYTFVAEGLGTHASLLTAWVGLIAIVLGVPYSFVLLSANLQALMIRWLGLNLPWAFWFVLLLGIAFAMCAWGVRESMNVDLTFFVFEIIICLILAAIVLFHAGQSGGLSLLPFTTAGVPRNGNIVAGIIFAILSFIGFETAATLGEETRNPHRNIPRAVFGSMIVVGIFYILMTYVGTIGYGINHMASGFANDPAPFDTIGRHYSSPIFVGLIDIAGLLSFFSAALAIINGGARIMYTVGRDKILPRWTAWLHPQRQTPIGSITALCLFGLIIGWPLGFIMTPIGAFGFLGMLDALFVMVVYVLVCLASIVFFWRKRRARFNIILHGIVPMLALLLMATIFVLLMTFPESPPLNLIPYIVLSWLGLGVVLILGLSNKLSVISRQEQTEEQQEALKSSD